MNSDRIYHYVNQFDVNFLLFKYRKYNRVVILGPFLHQRPNEKDATKCYNKYKLNILNYRY